MSTRNQPLRLVALIALAVLFATACGTESSPPATTDLEMTDETMEMTDDTMDMTDETMEMADNGGDEHVFAFGEPAEASEADRIIEIEALDTLSFDPETFDVAVGEVVTFRVSNTGAVPHDVVLDDEAGQAIHEEEMQEMAAAGTMAMEDEENGFAIASGETKEITWRFTEAGTVMLGCHQPGHFAAGMVATVAINP